MGNGGGDFVAKTLANITGSLEQAVFSEELARLPGLLQPIDPRSKVVAGLMLLVTAGLIRQLAVLAALYAATLLLGGLSRIPLAQFARRVWLGIPLFAALVALPSLFLLPGRPLLVLLDMPPVLLSVSDNGMGSFTVFVARVGTSVSLALLLVSTTRWTDLLRALRVLRVPDSFVVVLSMTYRYLFLLLHSAGSLFLARASRTVGATTGGEQRRWAASASGALMSRSVKVSGDVLLAMRARGFDGEIRSGRFSRMQDGDWLLLVMAAVLSAALLLMDQRLA